MSQVVEFEEHHSFNHGPTRVYRLPKIAGDCSNLPSPVVVITRETAETIDTALSVRLGELTRQLLRIPEIIQVAVIPGYLCITLMMGGSFGQGPGSIHSGVNLALSWNLDMGHVRADKIEPEF